VTSDRLEGVEIARSRWMRARRCPVDERGRQRNRDSVATASLGPRTADCGPKTPVDLDPHGRGPPLRTAIARVGAGLARTGAGSTGDLQTPDPVTEEPLARRQPRPSTPVGSAQTRLWLPAAVLSGSTAVRVSAEAPASGTRGRAQRLPVGGGGGGGVHQTRGVRVPSWWLARHGRALRRRRGARPPLRRRARPVPCLSPLRCERLSSAGRGS
jgi:hypothetical protein